MVKKKPANIDHKSEVIALPSGNWVLMRTRPSFQDGLAFESPDIVSEDGNPLGPMLAQMCILIQDWSFDSEVSPETVKNVPDIVDFQTLVNTFTDTVMPFLDQLQRLRSNAKPSTKPS